MMRSVFLKTLYDKRFFMLGWSVGMFALAMLMASFFPAMRPEGGFDTLIANMPAAFQGLVGDLADMRNFDTYIASQLFDIRMPLIAGIMAIILALGISTREEENGELRTQLSLPISRSKVFVEKWLAMISVMFVTVIALVAGVYVMTPFVEDAVIEFAAMAQLATMTWLVMIAFGSVTFAAGMASGKKSLTNFIGIFVIMGSFLLSTFAAAVDWLKEYEMFSLLHYFPAVEVVRDGLELANIAVLVSISFGVLLLAWLLFRRRDVA